MSAQHKQAMERARDNASDRGESITEEQVLDRAARQAAILKARDKGTGTIKQSRDTVVVGSKLQRALRIRDGQMMDVGVANPTGGRMTERQWVPNGDTVVIRGTNSLRGFQSDDPNSPNSDGYALTFNVPEDVWERWEYDNRESLLVLNRLVIGYPKVADVKAETKENRSRLTGMEPLAQEKDPRTPRSNFNVTREYEEDGKPRELKLDREPIVGG